MVAFPACYVGGARGVQYESNKFVFPELSLLSCDAKSASRYTDKKNNKPMDR